jgi:hypothetical protein
MSSIDELVQAKIYRLEELRKYQAHYGPNTPYPIIVEINNLEEELRRMLQAGSTRPTRAVKKKKPAKKKQPARKQVAKKKAAKAKQPPVWQIWRMSQATIDMVATIAFIGLVFLLGSIVVATYIHTRPSNAAPLPPEALAVSDLPLAPTLRPTFTPTVDPNAPAAEDASQVAAVEAEVAAAGDSFLPTAVLGATDIPTPVPTLTPSATPEATELPTPTEPPPPTDTPPPPPPRPTNTPAPPTATPAPTFPFKMVEQGNRMFQSTSYHVITVYVAVVSEGNIPLGGYKMVGDHVPSGAHVESGISSWDWSVTNCLDCDYIKQGNLKFEPGTFTDGTWNVYLADEGGNPVSETIPLSYSTDPAQWVWDFLIFRKQDS